MEMLKRNIYRHLDLPGLMQRAQDLSSVWSVNQVIGERILWRIEEIENLAPQFQLARLFEFEVFEDGEVRIVKGWSTKAAAACVPPRGRVDLPRGKRGKGERRGIVPTIYVLASRRGAAWSGASVVAAIE